MRAAACVGAFGLAAGVAGAGPIVDFVVYENADGVATGEIDIDLELVDVSASQLSFIFRNNSTIDCRVTDIFVENTAFSSIALDSPTIVNNGGAQYSSPSNMMGPGGNLTDFGGAWQGTLFSADPDTPMPNVNAVGPGEAITVFWSPNVAFQDIVDGLELSPAMFRAAAHVQGIGAGDSSIWVVTPSPGSAALLGIGGVLAARRRR